jgi:hypothetical protein
MRCHKDYFRFCIGLLPAYIDKIEELALSEEDTPGQIHAFLSFFPSFTLFKRLRKFYLHINGEAVQPLVIEKALHSLSNTTLDNLSIKITQPKVISSLNDAIIEIFHMKTLKKFSIVCYPSELINWESLNEVSSNIEYLTIDGLEFEVQDLKYIFRCASGLKYLNIRLLSDPFRDIYELKSSSKISITQMSVLHTVIFKMENHDEITPITLEPYLRVMPSLHRLEIKTDSEFYGINIWETMLIMSLPTVTCFNLQGGAFRSNEDNINALKCIQTPLWIEKKNFHLILKKFASNNNIWLDPDDQQKFGQYGLNRTIDQWWIGPRRKLSDNQSAMNTISSLNLSIESSSSLQDHYLDNVNDLVVQEFNGDLLELFITHVNCSKIKHLDVSFLKQKNHRIVLLLPYTRNIISVRINFNQLSDNQFAYLRECNKLKFVDLSSDSHDFDRKHILIIANMFPNIEHLVINTRDLRNVPILQTYLPRLRSLTFANTEQNNISFFNNYGQKMFDENLRQKTKFLFQRKGKWITVWIDQVALQDSYWQIINPN